jgi:uncharacterized protein (DUF2267 family)
MDERTFTTQVAKRLGCDERRATDVIFAVFQELRDRLTPGEADDVAAQLPTPLRRLWEVGEHPDREVRRVHEPEFVADVRAQAALPDDAAAERAVHAVFAVLQRALGSRTGREGEAGDVLSQLPADLKALWLAAGKRP